MSVIPRCQAKSIRRIGITISVILSATVQIAAAQSTAPAANTVLSTAASINSTPHVNNTNRRGFTPLEQSINDKDASQVAEILKDYQPFGPMELAENAVAHDRVDVLHEQLVAYPNLVYQRIPNGRTLLHVAALWQSSECVSLLLHSGANADARDANGATPLSLLLCQADTDIKRSPAPSKDLATTIRLAVEFISAGSDCNVTGAKQVRPLALAARFDSANLADGLIQHGAFVNAPSLGAQPALCFAVSSPMVELLFSKGADINASGNYPLIRAIDTNRTQVALCLIQHGADLSRQDWRGYSLLMHACQAGSTDVVEALLKKGVPIDYIAPDGNTALSVAGSHSSVANLLSSHGAKVVQVAPVLSFAPQSQLIDDIYQQDVDGVKADLISKPGSINTPDPLGKSPLAIALSDEAWFGDRQEQILGLLFRHGASAKSNGPFQQTPLALAVEAGGIDAVRFLLDHGAPVNGRSPIGATALFNAYDPAIIRLLAARGAEPNIVDDNGDTAMHNEARHGDREPAINALLSIGAKPSICNADGDQPLNILLRQHEWVKTNSPALIAKSNLTAPSQTGLSAGQQILEEGNPDILSGFTPAEPNLDPYTRFLVRVARNDVAYVQTTLAKHPNYAFTRLSDGSTALHIAAVWSATAVESILLKSGADPNARDAAGDGPLEWCTRTKPADITTVSFASALIDQGADPNLEDVSGNTSLDIATQNENGDLVALLTAHAAHKGPGTIGN